MSMLRKLVPHTAAKREYDATKIANGYLAEIEAVMNVRWRSRRPAHARFLRLRQSCLCASSSSEALQPATLL